MDEWIIAIILLTMSSAAVGAALLVCRAFGVWKLTGMDWSKEEKAVLTKNEQTCGQYNGNTMTTETTNCFSKSPPPESYREEIEAKEPSINASYSPVGDQDEELPPPSIQKSERTNSLTIQKSERTDSLTEPEKPNEDRAESPLNFDSVALGVSDLPLTGRIQRAMSCDSVSSDSSVLDMENDTARVGQLEFGIDFDWEAEELAVSIIQAKDLEPDSVTGTLDSFVKIWLSSQDENKQTTKIQKDDINPSYMERFLFNIVQQELNHTIVNFQVYSSDKYARHKLQGETEIRLGDVGIGHPLRLWMHLREMDQKPTELGDIMFSLSYLPTAERLTVVVVKGRNLKWCHGKETGDCFAKVYLLQNGKKVSKKKTSTKRNASSPIFNEAMIFNVPLTALQSIQLRVSLHESLPENNLNTIGHILVGSQLSGTELAHWNQMMTSLRKPIAMWHGLRK